MTLEEIRSVLLNASDVAMPRFTPAHTPPQKVDLLEDYLNLTAVTRAELERARLWAHTALHDLTAEWNAIQGWGMHLPESRGRATKDDIIAAKREVRPDLHSALTEAKWLVDRLTEQLDRLGARMGDDQVASRIYTLLVAG